MLVLIVGTPNSGKSARAEAITLQLANGGPRVYLATMEPYGEEGRARVEKHRKAREGKGFVTVERACELDALDAAGVGGANAAWLLECVSNLVGNEMYLPSNSELNEQDLAARIAGSVVRLADRVGALVAVTNEFPLDGPGYDAATRKYARVARAVNAALRAAADRVEELPEKEEERP